MVVASCSCAIKITKTMRVRRKRRRKMKKTMMIIIIVIVKHSTSLSCDGRPQDQLRLAAPLVHLTRSLALSHMTMTMLFHQHVTD